MKNVVAIGLSAFTLFVTGCEKQPPPEALPVEQPKVVEPAPVVPALPHHEIFDRSLSDEEGTLHVRLSGPIEKEEVERLARYLREEYPPYHYPRFLINFYLPEGKKGERPWAAVLFDPAFYLDMNPPVQFPSGEMIGCWRDADPVMGGIIELYRTRRGLRLQIHFNIDRSTLERWVEEVQDPRGRRLDIIGGNAHGEYYLIDKEGRFHLYDRRGLIRSADPV